MIAAAVSVDGATEKAHSAFQIFIHMNGSLPVIFVPDAGVIEPIAEQRVHTLARLYLRHKMGTSLARRSPSISAEAPTIATEGVG